ncbi:hypothetical protein bwei_1680 [Bacillus mycoides]|nr:hypothetical protein bwei_1680 [Bacillus mycoides]EEL06124.1 hypothetical protein bcere0014_22210 [Bacillus cereus BDRD-ST196]
MKDVKSSLKEILFMVMLFPQFFIALFFNEKIVVSDVLMSFLSILVTNKFP